MSLEDIEAAIKPDDAHFARTRLLTLENTLGGKLLPFEYVQAATDLAAKHGLARHLDGLAVEPPQTNMVFVDLTGAARTHSNALLAHMAENHIQATGLYRLRFVTHFDVNSEGVDRAAEVIRTFFKV